MTEDAILEQIFYRLYDPERTQVIGLSSTISTKTSAFLQELERYAQAQGIKVSSSNLDYLPVNIRPWIAPPLEPDALDHHIASIVASLSPKPGILALKTSFPGFLVSHVDGIVYLHLKKEAQRPENSSIAQLEVQANHERHISRYFEQFAALKNKFTVIDYANQDHAWIIPPTDYGLVTIPLRQSIEGN